MVRIQGRSGDARDPGNGAGERARERPESPCRKRASPQILRFWRSTVESEYLCERKQMGGSKFFPVHSLLEGRLLSLWVVAGDKLFFTAKLVFTEGSFFHEATIPREDCLTYCFFLEGTARGIVWDFSSHFGAMALVGLRTGIS